MGFCRTSTGLKNPRDARSGARDASQGFQGQDSRTSAGRFRLVCAGQGELQDVGKDQAPGSRAQERPSGADDFPHGGCRRPQSSHDCCKSIRHSLHAGLEDVQSFRLEAQSVDGTASEGVPSRAALSRKEGKESEAVTRRRGRQESLVHFFRGEPDVQRGTHPLEEVAAVAQDAPDKLT